MCTDTQVDGNTRIPVHHAPTLWDRVGSGHTECGECSSVHGYTLEIHIVQTVRSNKRTSGLALQKHVELGSCSSFAQQSADELRHSIASLAALKQTESEESETDSTKSDKPVRWRLGGLF